MSNVSIISRMATIVDDYEAGILSPEQLEMGVSFSMDALEHVDLATIHVARSLSQRLVGSHFWSGDEEFKNEDEVISVLRDLRELFRKLPREN